MLEFNVKDFAQTDHFLQEYIESLHRFPKARVQDLFLRKNIYAVTVRNHFKSSTTSCQNHNRIKTSTTEFGG